MTSPVDTIPNPLSSWFDGLPPPKETAQATDIETLLAEIQRTKEELEAEKQRNRLLMSENVALKMRRRSGSREGSDIGDMASVGERSVEENRKWCCSKKEFRFPYTKSLRSCMFSVQRSRP